jgi:tetratricopeptide (TPR) repeat protein
MKFFQYSPSRRVFSAASAVALLAGFGGLAYVIQSRTTANQPSQFSSTIGTPGASAPQLFTVPGMPGVPGRPNAARPNAPGQPLPNGTPAPTPLPNGQLPPGAVPPGQLPAQPNPAIAGDPKLAALFEKGVEAQRKGDLKAAALAYREVLRAKPDAVPAHMNMALLLLQQKQPDKAVWHLKKIATLSPRDPQPRAILAQAYQQMRKPELAYQQWTQIAEFKLPDNGQAAFNAGAIAFEQLKKLPEAERWLRRAFAQSKNQDPQSSLMLAKVLGARKKYGEAAKILEPVAKQFPQVTEIQTTLADAQWQSGAKSKATVTLAVLETNTPATLNKGQNLGQVRMMLGRAQAAQGNYVQAVTTLNKAIDVLPKDSPALQPAKGLLAQTLAARAESEEKQGQVKKAVASWKEAAVIFPDNPFPYIQLGRLLDKDGDDKEALEQYNRALKIVPRDANALSGAAQLEEKAGSTARATAHWKTIIETRPEHPAAYFNLARLAARQKQLAQTMDYLETKLAKNPNLRAPYDAILEAGHDAGRAELARDWVEIMAKKYPKAAAPRNAIIAYERRHPAPKPEKKPTPTATPTPKPTATPAPKQKPEEKDDDKPQPQATPKPDEKDDDKPQPLATPKPAPAKSEAKEEKTDATDAVKDKNDATEPA